MRSLTYIAIFDGIALPILQLHASWIAGGFSDSYTIVLPGTPETERILPSTQVHLWSLDSKSVTTGRQVMRIDRDNLRAEGLWVEQSLKTIGDQFDVPLSTEGGDSAYLKLVDALPLKGYMYRGGGEVVSVSTGGSARASRTVVLRCQGYSGNLNRITAIQALGSAGTLSDVDRQIMGQREAVFPGKGRRAFAKGALDLLNREDGNLILGLKEFVSLYSLNVNPMWRTRLPLTRIENQMVGLDDDTGPKRLLEGPDFKMILKEQLASVQDVGLGELSGLILALVGYVSVAIPSPAYFPLAPSEKMLTVGHKILSPERVEEYIAPPGIVVLVPETDSVEFMDTPPPWAKLHGGNIKWLARAPDAMHQYGWWTESGGSGGPVGSAAAQSPVRLRVKKTFHKGGRRGGSYKVNADRSVTVRFTLPDKWTGGAASYEHTLTLSVTAMAQPRHPETNELQAPEPSNYNRDTTEETYTDFPLRHLVRNQTTTNVALQNKAAGQRDLLEVGIRFTAGGPRTKTIPAVTEPIEEEELVDGMLPNWVSRLNTYAVLPHLWWAMFPACNIVLPHQVLSWSSNSAGMDRITRLVAKVPPTRSGSRATYSDKFPAPTEADLDSILSSERATFDPKKMFKFEYISGVTPDLWYVDTLSKAMKDKSWERFMKSRTSMEFWSRRLAGETLNLSVHYDPSLVPGAPLLFVANLDAVADPPDPELLSLRIRLRNLRRLLALLKKKNRSGGSSRTNTDDLLRHLVCVWNGKALRKHATERKITLSRGPSGEAVDLNWADTHLANVTHRLKAVGVSIEDFWKIAKGRTFGGQYPVRTSVTSWGIVPGLRALGLTHETIGEAGITYDQAKALFNAKSSVTASFRVLHNLMNYLSEGKKEAAARRAAVAPCLSAVRSDIKVVNEAITETEEAIRKLGGSGGTEPEAYIGYVVSISQNTAGEGMTSTLDLELTHVRKVSEDIDFNGLGGDDLENVIAFGENGYLDERYSREKIGKDVYLPIFGCAAGIDIPGVREKMEELLTNISEGTSGEFRELLFDLDPLMKHPEACGVNFLEQIRKDPGDKDIVTEFDVASAIIELYRDEIGALPEEQRYEAFIRWKSRLYMNLAESYLGKKVAYSSVDYRPEVVDNQDLATELRTMYKEGEPLIQGFFATSFVGPEGDEETAKALKPRAMKGEKTAPELVEHEISLLLDRLSRVVDAASSLEDGTT